MESIFRYFDFNQGGTSRKLFGHKKHDGGLEAPRNSLEFPIESSQTFHTQHEDTPVKRRSSKSIRHSNQSTMKMSETNSDTSNRMQTRRYAPGVVARLMGMDSLSSDENLSFPSEISIDTKPISSSHDILPRSLAPFYSTLDSDKSNNGGKRTKPHPREHPQEELLQKFKKEFRAWQASKSLDRNLLLLEDNQSLAQDKLNPLKMVRCMEATRTSVPDEPMKSRIHCSIDAFQCKVHTSKQFRLNVRKEMKCSRDGYLAVTNNENDEEEGNMENFLREVKERLRLEVQGKTRNSFTDRAIFSDGSFSENSNDTRNIARHIAKQIKRNVTREIGTTLKRSESTQSCRSQIQSSALDCSEFINSDTKNRANVWSSVRQMPELSKTATKSRNRRSFGCSRVRIDKQQEKSEQKSPKVRKCKKDGFGIKGKVSNLKQNLALKRRFLFTRQKPASRTVIKSLNPIFAEPSVVMNLGIVQDNHTEVPPSPVSPLGAPFTEFCSEISEQTIGEEQTFYEDEQVESRDIQSNLSYRNGREIGMKHNLLFDLMNEMIHSCKVTQLEMKTNTAFDLKLTSWSSSSHEVVDFVGREMELFIFGELIDEFVCELFL